MEYRCSWNSPKIASFFLLLALNLELSKGALWSSYNNAGQQNQQKCSGSKGLKYLSGNALTDLPDCLGPNNTPYPSALIARTVNNWNGSSRRGRQSKLPVTLNPAETTSTLLRAYREANNEELKSNRFERSIDSLRSSSSGGSQCRGSPARLCKTIYNTTAPMYGVSLTSGQPVTIVQKFPDLLQQVVYEACESTECEVVHGECTQTYVPYLFLVIPLGPVTLTGQDYVLVESGCVCKPRQYSEMAKESNIIP